MVVSFVSSWMEGLHTETALVDTGKTQTSFDVSSLPQETGRQERGGSQTQREDKNYAFSFLQAAHTLGEKKRGLFGSDGAPVCQRAHVPLLRETIVTFLLRGQLDIVLSLA